MARNKAQEKIAELARQYVDLQDASDKDESPVDSTMYRQDGSVKSARGFLGPIKNKIDGGTMTEFSTDMQYKGKSIEVPTMVPTLSESEIEYMRGMEPGTGFDLSNPTEKAIVNKARAHAKKRLDSGLSQFYQDGEDETPKKRNASDIAKEIVQREKDARAGLTTEVLESVTFGFLGELVSAAKAATSDREYAEIKREYEAKRRVWKRNNPELADYALPLEIAATLPTGIGLAKTLAKAGVKTVTKQGAFEGGLYGFGSGDGIEGRVIGTAMGAFGGATLGRIVDLAIKPTAKGGLKTQADEAADLAIVRDTELDDLAIQKALDDEVYAEVETKDYIVKPISEAKTFGEFWSSITGNLRKFYDSAITGTSDDVSRNVSRDVGSRIQRADETALREINKGLGTLAERLVPVIQIINESARAKGALLDFGANKFAEKGTRQESLDRLRNELSQDLNAEHMKTLEEYLAYSYQKNTTLNAKVFGGTFDADTTYLHTRDRSFIKRKKEEGLTDSEIEKMFDDPAQRPRNRGSYTDQIPNADGKIPRPDDYDNPIISDMQRIFRMERLNQIQRIFGVKIDDVLAAKRSLAKNPDKVVLSPQEFMDATFYTINKKGISNDGAKYAVDRMTETIMGQDATPHPLIQALSSASYATTLAGPMSAILNLADVPLLGAKYGGRAVLEGLKEANPKKFFGKPSDIDLEKMGLGNQNFGEFVNKANEKIGDTKGWLSRTAGAVREGSDFLMKGSGFAAMDKVGKKGVMRGVLKSAADDAQAGRLGDNWSFYFNKSELDILERELKQHGMDWQNYQAEVEIL